MRGIQYTVYSFGFNDGRWQMAVSKNQFWIQNTEYSFIFGVDS